MIDGKVDAESCFAVSSTGQQVIIKSPKENFLEVVDVCDADCNIKKRYFIDQKYLAKRWLYLEKINESKLLALLESQNKWWLMTFLIGNDSSNLVKLHRTPVYRLRHKTTTTCVKCQREGIKFRFMIIQANSLNDKKYCSLLECQVIILVFRYWIGV